LIGSRQGYCKLKTGCHFYDSQCIEGIYTIHKKLNLQELTSVTVGEWGYTSHSTDCSHFGDESYQAITCSWYRQQNSKQTRENTHEKAQNIKKYTQSGKQKEE